MARFDYVYNLGPDSLRFSRVACDKCGCGTEKVVIYHDQHLSKGTTALSQLDVTGPMASALWDMMADVGAKKEAGRFGLL